MKKREIKQVVAKSFAEQATGICENPHGLGRFFVSAECPVTPQEAYDAMREGRCVEVPNAGAGSFRAFFKACGFSDVEEFQTGSSAGDWVFAVEDGEAGDWYPAFQSNRYPYHGFSYSVDFSEPHESFEQFCELNS